MSKDHDTSGKTIITTRKNHVWQIELNRPNKMNAFNLQMLRELAEAYTTFEDDPELRCALVIANGEHFTAGLDLAEVGPAVQSGAALFPDKLVDPLGLRGRCRTKPVVMAAQGYCLTIGIELLLSADIRLVADGATLGQIEINRGIFPFGGATIRMPSVAGWGNAMRWLLTGDNFDAAEAFRIGLAQEMTTKESLVPKATAIAETVAKRAPLGVQATIASAKTAADAGPKAAADELLGIATRLMKTEDAREGLLSFVERREAKFTGR